MDCETKVCASEIARAKKRSTEFLSIFILRSSLSTPNLNNDLVKQILCIKAYFSVPNYDQVATIWNMSFICHKSFSQI